ncbi:hypothetical protein LAZ40_02680 [Cereibacter sphaeroides]|uniref:hypothetical protein n=1 Tax=Cereibacter sphaeroides TaxID=1063 RepID=UPI001F4012C4|nr:hypothetical protein [Cereibacter sphaeroides]MCE6957962.1 hypothetical protein [Cereibacter sphaeroides]MCE6967650.1 hypothetical protein [Cereibacter sphaeroides]MCE6971769.1 hypothetical protein [Cereibacter sphaeroides]
MFDGRQPGAEVVPLGVAIDLLELHQRMPMPETEAHLAKLPVAAERHRLDRRA